MGSDTMTYNMVRFTILVLCCRAAVRAMLHWFNVRLVNQMRQFQGAE